MSDRIQTKILYIERNRRKGFSIHKVFLPLIRQNNDISSVIEVPCHKAGLFSIFKNVIWTFSRRNKKGINHITGDVHYLTMALPGCKTILTVHDLVTLRIPGNKLKRWLLRTLWFKIPLKQADHITCISNTTRNELIKEFNLPAEKVTTVYNPVDTIFNPTPKEFNSSKPRILHIGTGWNKNLNRVIEALKDIECKLVIVGELDDRQKSALYNSNIDYEQMSNLSDEELLHEYEKCDIVSFPSIYEGFGMPIIEGQAVGRIVLTSAIEPMTEISADSTVLVNPESVNSIRDGFIKIMNNEDYRKEMINRGFKNVVRFSADKIAVQYDAIYNKIINT